MLFYEMRAMGYDASLNVNVDFIGDFVKDADLSNC